MSEELIRRSDAIDIIEITPFEDYGDYIKAREIIVDYKHVVLTCDDEGNWSMHGERKESE